ncbi:MAG: hypothetical protein A3G41_02275 [Elusimicrobia bacterium RIFCSPLOWO2_12_FULL_59_9]|nr:MAG: hypothetical protein A3G41_02275 [Elusimicrobia bacterium RIFCSPLOWO2_12_FULL_59_9]
MEQKTALLYVSDRTGIVEFAFELSRLGYAIVSAGATAKLLLQAEVVIEEVENLADLPEPWDMRLKMAQPRLFAGLSMPAGAADLHIGLAAINLYPISEIAEKGYLSETEVMEYVDPGASALLKAAARNFTQVISLCDPMDYEDTVSALSEFKDIHLKRRRELAAKSFSHCSYHDATVAQYLAHDWTAFPEEWVIGLKKNQDIKFGENPHQKAALYRRTGERPWGLPAAKLLQGSALSFNHYLDLETAWDLVSEQTDSACALVKHASLVGAAAGYRLSENFRLAWESDPANAPGSLVAFNREVDAETAKQIADVYLECAVAPEFSQEAAEVLKLKKDLRLITLPSSLIAAKEINIHPISGGLLVQEQNQHTLPVEIRAVTQRTPTETEMHALKFSWLIAKHTKSSAAVLSCGTRTIGIGSGQPSATEAIRIALFKSRNRHPILAPSDSLVLASDGPLSMDCIVEAMHTGVQAIIQPGGTSHDNHTVHVCNQKGISMVFTGLRHFRH